MTVATAPVGTSWVNQRHYDELADEARQLIKLLKHQAHARPQPYTKHQVSLELQMQVEKLELLIGAAK
jgi:hypothetical protein